MATITTGMTTWNDTIYIWYECIGEPVAGCCWRVVGLGIDNL